MAGLERSDTVVSEAREARVPPNGPQQGKMVYR